MSDTWHEEVETRLETSYIYKKLVEKCQDDKGGPHVLALVSEATFYVNNRVKTILRHMGEYTLHDSDHIFQVLKIMELLLGKENIDNLSLPELMLLVLACFFHDIGMSPSEGDVLAWKKNWDIIASPSDAENEEYCLFKRYLSARPEKESQIKELMVQGEFSKAELVKAYLISDYIRETHAERARTIIAADWNGKIRYKDTDLTVEFAEICFSHIADPLSLLGLDFQYLCGQAEFICLPLVGVILRLADILDFDSKRTPSVLLSNLAVRNPVSLSEWKKHRSVEAWVIRPDLIQYHAKCRHPAIESAIYEFCDLIDRELSACNNVNNEINKHFSTAGGKVQIVTPYKVDRSKIETKKDIYGKPEYIFRETRFSLSKNQVIDLLMGTKLYGNPEVALRELLQNSIDACLLRLAMEKSWGNSFNPEIKVRYWIEAETAYLEVLDNGIGMDQDIIDKYYTNIGSSFYKSTDFYDLKAKSNADFTPTSRFGIGILSCFMVSDVLIVETRRLYEPHSSSQPINLTIEGQDSIFWIKPGTRTMPGTSTKLILRKNRNPWEELTDEEFVQSVETVLPNPPFKIHIETSGIVRIRDENSFREVRAETLKGSYWKSHENLKEIEFDISSPSDGIVASVIVGILETHGKPTKSIELSAKEIVIEGQTYPLDKSISVGDNTIRQTSTTITIDDDRNIGTSSNMSTLAESASRISLHGIEIPVSLFPQRWKVQKNQVRMTWPFPILIVVDICGKRDINLNSARNQILICDKWLDFEEKLAFSVCSGIKNSVSNEYWLELKELLISSTQSEPFSAGMGNVE